jgi:hypothetical protein
MAVPKALIELFFWFFLCLAIPAALLYPFALWAAKHTLVSVDAIANSYMIGIALLFFPALFLVNFICCRFVLHQTSTPDVKAADLK